MSPWEAVRRGGSPALLPESCSEARASGSRTSSKACRPLTQLSLGHLPDSIPISRHIRGAQTAGEHQLKAFVAERTGVLCVGWSSAVLAQGAHRCLGKGQGKQVTHGSSHLRAAMEMCGFHIIVMTTLPQYNWVHMQTYKIRVFLFVFFAGGCETGFL